MYRRQRDYRSYLLRLWRENEEEGARAQEGAVWRASLETPQAGERTGFASLAELFAFLDQETGRQVPDRQASNQEGGKT